TGRPSFLRRLLHRSLRSSCVSFRRCCGEVRDEGLPAVDVLAAVLLAVRAELLPAALLDLDPGGTGARRDELDLDLGRLVALPADVPQVPEGLRRFPHGHLAPVVLDAVGRPFEDPPA